MAARKRTELTTRDTLCGDDLVSRKIDETGRDVPFFQRDSGGMRAIDSTDTYYVGVIDILIQFGAKKKMEHKWKSVRAELQHRLLMHAACTSTYVPRTNSVLIYLGSDSKQEFAG